MADRKRSISADTDVDGGAVTTQDLVRRRKLWPVTEAAFQLGLHRVTLYRLAEKGDIAFTRVGGRTFVTDAELDRFIARAEVRSEASTVR